MIECPLCHQLRESLSANGYCHDCPEYKEWLRVTNTPKQNGRYKRINKLRGKPQGRSRKVEKC